MNNIASTEVLLKTKQHYEILDGLRGIAAVAVVVFHFMEIAIADYNNNFVAHGYLAVDFFFCLSGFVITYAYDSRIAGMGLKTFIKLRLIRLQPLVIIGSVLGLLTFLFDPFSNLYATYGFIQSALIFIMSVFVIPYPVMPERFFNLFSLNAPSWSLFWEYVANFVYATILFKATKKLLAPLVLLAAFAICYVAWNSNNLAGGWGGPNFFDGLARISFSFLMGMLSANGWLSLSVSLLVGTGFLGAYRTFSTLNFELLMLKKNKRCFLFILYLVSSYCLGLMSAAIGYGVGKILVKIVG